MFNQCIKKFRISSKWKVNLSFDFHSLSLIHHSFRLESAQQRRPPPAPITSRPSSSLGVRSPSRVGQYHSNVTSSYSNLHNVNTSAESTLLDENGLPRVGHLLAFTPDVIQVFQDAAKGLEESREIKKQTMNQIRDAFNDAKSYSITINQSVAQKLADIITLAVRLHFPLNLSSILLSYA